jgi:methyl-accepting chemotaxis protein
MVLKHAAANRTLWLGFAGGGVLILLLALFAFWASWQQLDSWKSVSHTHEVLGALGKVRSSLIDIESAPRGYVITGNDSYLEPYRAGLVELDNAMSRVAKLTRSDSTLASGLGRLRAAVSERVASAAKIVDARDGGGFAAAKKLIESDVPKRQMDRVRAVLDELEAAERALLEEWRERQQRQLEIFRWTIMLIGAVAAGIALLYYLIRRRRSSLRGAAP